MKLFLLGRRGSINHWLEDAAGAFRGDGHEVEIGIVRHPALHERLQGALARPMAARISARARRFGPDLILGIGGYHVPPSVLEALRRLPGRPPVVGWVGDAFGAEAHTLARLYDLVAHTDSGLQARHRRLGFAAPTLWLPHAANPRRVVPRRPRYDDMVFIAAASPERRRVLAAIDQPVAVYGPGWAVDPPSRHRIFGRRVAHDALPGLYAGHLASLNVRNESNVLAGLNQRNFDPYLFGAPVVADDQPDLERCFDPGEQVLVYREAEALDAIYRHLRARPHVAAEVAAAGLRRILAEHTFAHRLNAITKAL